MHMGVQINMHINRTSSISTVQKVTFVPTKIARCASILPRSFEKLSVNTNTPMLLYHFLSRPER